MVVSYTDDNQFLNDLPWTVNYVGYNDSDSLLDAGEKAEITLWLLDRVTGTAIGTNGSIALMDGSGGAGGMAATSTILAVNNDFAIEIKPEDGSVLNIQRTLPGKLETATT